jgi:hypothetical protein
MGAPASETEGTSTSGSRQAGRPFSRAFLPPPGESPPHSGLARTSVILILNYFYNFNNLHYTIQQKYKTYRGNCIIVSGTDISKNPESVGETGSLYQLILDALPVDMLLKAHEVTELSCTRQNADGIPPAQYPS